MTALSDLLKDGAPWKRIQYQEHAFYDVRATLTSALVQKLPDFSLDFVVTIDASEWALSQLHDGVSHPVPFYSQKRRGTAEQK